jgi:hypothetical protein
LASTLAKSNERESVWIAAGGSLLVGFLGLQLIEPVHRDGFGNWELLFGPFVIAYWALMAFCLLWPAIVQCQGWRNLDLLIVKIPLFVLGLLLVTISVNEHGYAKKVLVEDRKFWAAVLDKKTVDLPIEAYRKHLSSAGKDAVRHQLHYSDDFSVPMLRLLNDLGFDVSGEPNLDPELVMALRDESKRNEQKHAAGSPAANHISSSLARNPGVSVDVLREISQSDDFYVLQELAMNSSAPPEMLLALIQRAESGISKAKDRPKGKEDFWAWNHWSEIKKRCERTLARNPKTPERVLRELARNPDEEIQIRVAWNPSVPYDMLLQMGNASAENVAKNATTHLARHGKTPEKMLRKLSEDPREEVRIAVAKNPHTPRDVMERLLNEKNQHVWFEAFCTLASDEPVPEALLRARLETASVYELRSLAFDAGRPEWVYIELAKSRRGDAARLAVKQLEKLKTKK